jgi:hypothetical protein
VTGASCLRAGRIGMQQGPGAQPGLACSMAVHVDTASPCGCSLGAPQALLRAPEKDGSWVEAVQTGAGDGVCAAAGVPLLSSFGAAFFESPLPAKYSGLLAVLRLILQRSAAVSRVHVPRASAKQHRLQSCSASLSARLDGVLTRACVRCEATSPKAAGRWWRHRPRSLAQGCARSKNAVTGPILDGSWMVCGHRHTEKIV